MITVGLGNESGWAKKINYKYIKKQKNKMKKKSKFSQPLRSSCRPPLLLFAYLNNILILLHL